jgi:hypothetical protein
VWNRVASVNSRLRPFAPGAKSSFFDMTVASDDTIGKPCILCSAAPGYNDVTGLGAPNVGNLLGYF